MPDGAVVAAPDTDTLRRLGEESRRRLSDCANEADLAQIKAAFLGRRGAVSEILKSLGKLPTAARREAGIRANEARIEIESQIESRRGQIRAEKINRELALDIDVTLPGRARGAGGLHPVTLAAERAISILAAMGFETALGPEIESDECNFTRLNHPPDHPARSMHDTFYIDGAPDLLLRTHTSPVQIRHMLARGGRIPMRAIAPGRVYRVDHDSTHSPMFHQIEGIWIDESVSFADLKGVLTNFFVRFFDDESLRTRFRPSFFPFTQPSAECDISRPGGWLEICGCGMMHPNVLAAGGVDNPRAQGFAFGMGIDRLAMLYYGVDDIRKLFANDLRFLSQFDRR